MKIKQYQILAIIFGVIGMTMVTYSIGWVGALGIFLAIWADNLDKLKI